MLLPRLIHSNIILRREASMVPETLLAFRVGRLPQECSLSIFRCRPTRCRFPTDLETASGTSWTGKMLPSKAWRTTIRFSLRGQHSEEIQSWATFQLLHERTCPKSNPHSPWAWPSMEEAASAAHQDSSSRWWWWITPTHRHKSAMRCNQVRPYPDSQAMPSGSTVKPPSSIARSRIATETIKMTR